MSETNASPEPLPQLQFPSLSQLEIFALRAFFELLDAWDQEMQHGD
jgi:hypothetical protein